MAKLKIFIGGIHGTGKGTLCRDLGNHMISEYISASKLLNWESKSKQVANVSKNQTILAELLKSHTKKDSSYVIDGHFALWNKKNECEVVPIQTFSSINLDVIIVATCSPEKILERLTNRDGIAYKLEDIQKLQSLEISQAELVSKSLAIPLILFDTTKNFNTNNIIKKIETMKQYTRENIISQMLKTVIIRLDFSGLTSIRSFVNCIKNEEKMQETFGKMIMVPKRNMSISFKSEDIEDGLLPISETQKSIMYRFFESKIDHSKVNLDIDPESITLAIDCKDDYHGSKKYSIFMGWLINELRKFDPYVTINRLGVRKIDVQILEPDESIDKYFNEKYVVSQSWACTPQKTKSILTELFELDNINFNVIQHIDRNGDGKERLIYDVDSFLTGISLEKALSEGDAADILYHDMQDRMFDLFVSVASKNYLDKCKISMNK